MPADFTAFRFVRGPHLGNVQRGVFPLSLYLYLTYIKNGKHKQPDSYRSPIAYVRKIRLFSAKTQP